VLATGPRNVTSPSTVGPRWVPAVTSLLTASLSI
jgi:hypothetical protein